MRRKSLSFYLVLFFGASVMLFTGCSSGGNGGGISPPTPHSITVTADPISISTGGILSIIEATVSDSDGDGLQGVCVTFATDLGTLDHTSVDTDKQGVARTSLKSGDKAGHATVTASVTGLHYVPTTVTISPGPALIAVTADPTAIYTGGNSSSIEAKVTDINGHGFKGVRVTFDTTLGTLDHVCVDTDEQGVARTTLTSGDEAADATVTASAPGLSYVTTKVKISPAPAHITVTADPTSINTGGNSSTIEATVTDSEGLGVQGVTVTFATIVGTLDHTSVDTNDKGVATTTLTSGYEAGNATVTASTIGLTDAATTVIITAPVPATIEVFSIERDQIYIRGSGNAETSKVTFSVKGLAGGPGSQTLIHFSLVGGSSGGEYVVPASNVVGADWKVSTTLKAGEEPRAVQIRASYSDSVYSSPTIINILGGPPEGRHLSLSLEKKNIIGLFEDTISTDLATLNLADLYGNPVPDGTAVCFKSEYAKIQGGDVTTTNGVVSADLITQDPRPANGDPVHIWAQTNSGGYAYISKLYVSGDTVYAATDGGGIFKSIDNGDNWSNIGRPKSYCEGEEGLWGTCVNDITVNTYHGLNDVMVATEDGGASYSGDGGYNWTHFDSQSDRYTDYGVDDNGDGAILRYHPIHSIDAISPFGSRRGRIEVTDASGAPYVSWQICGRTFLAADPGTYNVTYDIDYGMPPRTAKIIKQYDNDTYFAHFNGKKLYKFLKDEMYWRPFGKDLPSIEISTIAIVVPDIYVTIGGQVYKSSVAQDNFLSVGSSQPVAFNDAFVVGTNIYYTSNDGEIRKFDTRNDQCSDQCSDRCSDRWETICDPTCNYPENIRRVWVVNGYLHETSIYAATDYGLYRFDENGGSWRAYPLNVYKEVIVVPPPDSTTTLTLSYASDGNKAHTTIYVDCDEIADDKYTFTDSKTISVDDGISAGSTVEVSYALKPDDSSSVYTSAPEKKITALYHNDGKLYFGTENRKLYCLMNPAECSINNALPQIKDISGMARRISPALYKTGSVMFSGHTQAYALLDTDGDGFFDNHSDSVYVADSASTAICVVISDENNRPLVSGSRFTASTDVGGLSGTTSYTWGDEKYGPSSFGITLYDKDPGDNPLDPDTGAPIPNPESGEITIKVESNNGSRTLTIPVVVD